MNTELLVSNIKNASICVHNIEITPRDSLCDWHIHDEYELYMHIEGTTIFHIGDCAYSFGEGDIILIAENIPHKSETKQGSKGFLIQFRAEQSAYVRLPQIENNEFYFKSGSEINRRLSACLWEIIGEYSRKEPYFEDFIKAEMHKIFALFYRYEIIRLPEYYRNADELKRLLPVVDFINENYKSRISLEDMSGLLNIDKSHFCRLFKSAVGVPMVDYLNYVRITNAEKLLLSDRAMPVGEIAEQVGFQSEAYFCKLFKRYKSCSPTQYRKFKIASSDSVI